jgi:peptidoglycan hydrolase-like protein with peptidoglycan-binding domain
MRVLLLLALPGLMLLGRSTQPETKPAPIKGQEMAYAPPDVIDDLPSKRVEAPAPPKKPPPPPDNSLRPGSRGPAVAALEERLASLGYLVGKVDGVFDEATKHGVMAFQKVEGLPRNGRGTDATVARLPEASTPAPKYSAPADHLEVDIPRQVAFVVKGGKVTHIVAVVTGSGKTFWHPKQKRNVKAITPNGTYRIYYKKPGLHISPLGMMYWSSFFNGGIAFHGSRSMVPYPASHGCVRLPMTFHEWFYNTVSPRGMTVFVYGGPAGANPQPVIEEGPPAAGAEGASATPAPSPSPEPSPSPSPTPSPSPSIPKPSD